MTTKNRLERFIKDSKNVLEVNYFLRKAASASTPVVEISESEGVWSIKTSTAVKTHTVKFKVSVTMRLNPGPELHEM